MKSRSEGEERFIGAQDACDGQRHGHRLPRRDRVRWLSYVEVHFDEIFWMPGFWRR